MSGSKPRLVFAGTPDFAAQSLAILLHHPAIELVAVYTQPDRPAGRGRQPTASPVKQLAVARQLPVYQPPSLKPVAVFDELAALRPDLIIVAAYGLIIPADILNLPRLGCVNVHASLLPRWRGAAPIQRAILAGDEATGITIMQMEPGLDTGPMLYKSACRIAADETAASLHDRLAALGAECLEHILPAILAGEAQAEPQDESLATYAAKINRDEAGLDFQRPAADLARAVRAYFPKPVATALLGNQEVRILAAEALPDCGSGLVPGTQIDHPKELQIATGQGALRIIRLQLPGRRPILGTDYRNAQRAQNA